MAYLRGNANVEDIACFEYGGNVNDLVVRFRQGNTDMEMPLVQLVGCVKQGEVTDQVINIVCVIYRPPLENRTIGERLHTAATGGSAGTPLPRDGPNESPLGCTDGPLPDPEEWLHDYALLDDSLESGREFGYLSDP
eukprot:m51a1_g257 hypothetical protein (137) ;mRNA; f:215257-215784